MKNAPPTEAFLTGNRREFTAFRRALKKWSIANQRNLPWRGLGDPYRVWISEIMLQQTTVAAVIPYYERFLLKFPDVRALAAANEVDVLRLWEGLGYYSRARNLHKGAQVLVQQYDGKFPREVASLLKLPGIGRYTAGAIASFAFDVRAPIVEANTLRLYCRLMGFEGDPRSASGQSVLWKFAEDSLPKRDVGAFNQALMDLGATVCTPAQPACPSCPVQRWCRALANDRVEQIPKFAPRQKPTEVTAYATAIRKEKNYLLRRCPPGERWSGLWDFPRWEFEQDNLPQGKLEAKLSHWLAEFTGLQVTLGPQIAQYRHSVTRFRITLNCILAEHQAGRLSTKEEWAWVAPQHFSDYPLSVTGRKIAQRLQEGLL